MEATAREILVASIVDGMNRYVNQALLPAKLISETEWRASSGLGSTVDTMKHAIAQDIASKWEKALEARLQGR